MPESAELYRLSAFAEQPGGGNPAGVWLGPTLPDPGRMQQIAQEVGYSETAFIAPTSGMQRQIRYYSPLAEVSFCGHATIASGVVLGRTCGAGSYQLQTVVGTVEVSVSEQDQQWRATLRSVETSHRQVDDEWLAPILAALDWRLADLDRSIPPAVAYAGAHHLVLAVSTPERLHRLDYDFELLQRLMNERGLTTLQLIWREHRERFHSRNPFPVGGVVEDPATGAAAAALGGYLRDAGLIEGPARFEIIQGVAMGRPSRLHVAVPASGGIEVSGSAVDLLA